MERDLFPALDRDFLPIHAAVERYEAAARRAGSRRITFVIERKEGNFLVGLDAFPDSMFDGETYRIAERLVKSALWVCGGYRVGVHGSPAVYRKLKQDYAIGSTHAFDADFMSAVYERPFEVELLDAVPPLRPYSRRIGGHLEGCRIGFDAGGSDRKVSAVVDGKAIYSEEVVWSPKTQEDPHYHYEGVLAAMRTAASKMPRVDAIGVSTAGVCVDDRVMVSSLFLKVDKTRYGTFVKDLYRNAAREMGAPVTVANDGDVTALAGSMELGEGRVLGIAMGTSEAAGYINAERGLNGWLSELAFAPVDLGENAAVDEWSGDRGVGCKYFSQDAVIKLARLGGMELFGQTPAEKLKEVQLRAEEGEGLALEIFSDIGIYLGHTLPWYARFYDIGHVLLLGRVMSGKGGDLTLRRAREVLARCYPELTIRISTPDEKNRRVGQSIAAASLPQL